MPEPVVQHSERLESVATFDDALRRGGVIVISDPVNDRNRPEPGPAIHLPEASHVSAANLRSTLATGNGAYWWAPSVRAAQREIEHAHPCLSKECFG
jgi:hypothetical protein